MHQLKNNSDVSSASKFFVFVENLRLQKCNKGLYTIFLHLVSNAHKDITKFLKCNEMIEGSKLKLELKKKTS